MQVTGYRPGLAPLHLACACIVVLALVGMGRDYLRPQPHNPWGAAQLVEGWRSGRGLPVYEPAESGHATHMYGPLTPMLLGQLFRVFGPSVRTVRGLAIVSTLGLIVLLSAVAVRLNPARRAHTAIVALALFFGINSLAGNYFAQGRPDMTALFIALVGTILMYRGRQRRRFVEYGCGACVVVLACFFKQTAAVAALIPIVPVLRRTEDRVVTRLVWAFMPAALVVGALIVVGWLAPTVAHYMIQVPASYRVRIVRLATEAPLFVGSIVIFHAMAFRHLLHPQRVEWFDPVSEWALSATLVTVPTSALAFAKDGGTLNSWLPALLAMMLYSLMQMARLPDTVPSGSRMYAYAWGVATAILVVLTFPRQAGVLGFSPFYDDYPSTIEVVRQLPAGQVISPEDPTIALFARGTAGRSLYLEYDNAGWPATFPPYVRQDFQRARFIVDVKGWWQDLLQAPDLAREGFTLRADFPHYSVWERRSAPGE